MGRRAAHVKYAGYIRLHWQWSIILACTLIILDAVLLWKYPTAGLISLIFTAFYFLMILVFYAWCKPRILQDLIGFASGYSFVQAKILREFQVPAAVMDPDGKVLWLNEKMCELTQRKDSFHRNISILFPEVNRGTMPVTGSEKEVLIEYEEKCFHGYIQKVSLEEIKEHSSMVERAPDLEYLYVLYLMDETELNRYKKENREQKSVIGLIYIDNYEDIMERTEEVRQSLLNVMVERRINKYFGEVGGLIKKLEKDKYLLITNQKGLDVLIEDHFSLLEGVKIINIGNEINITLSIGIGAEGKNYHENYSFARGAMEMALGRGGDQAVVKSGEELAFYGGKSQIGERTTRVKSRMKAQALRELILSMESVITMGHTMTDMDSFGTSLGVYRAARTVGKPAHIVLGELNSNIRGWVQTFRESKDYDPGMFITHEQAEAMTDESTVLIVVDTNQAGRTECPQLLDKAGALVVLDHHRKAMDTIDTAALNYIEPLASSSCEMISEILQYFEESVPLSSTEADCIYAGMVVDTNNFSAKTGVRTFEAAAYLRRCGADVTRVRKSLRDSFENYKAKASVVSSAEKYLDCYAISVLVTDDLEDPNVVGAQAANELLNIVGVRASFVLTQFDNRIFISARSIDEANVQLVMERLGGGGHLNMAGAQLSGVTLEEAVAQVKQVLWEMTQQGAI